MGSVRVAELFAGVGGFRLGLCGHVGEDVATSLPSSGPYEVVWANQWEPPGTVPRQFAWRCYENHFGDGLCVNEDIHAVMNEVESGVCEIPEADMVVGGFPCFVAGTLVLTSDGYRRIEEVSVGDEVLTHAGRLRRVVRVGHKDGAPLMTVSCGSSRVVTCTLNHPFMVRSREGDAFGGLREVAAKDLVCGRDFVMSAHVDSAEAFRDPRLGVLSSRVFPVSDVPGSVCLDGVFYVPVLEMWSLGVRGTVYNFEVEDDHTYVVHGLVVHNCQDYSVAKPLSRSGGIEGRKGVLWWEIYRLLRLRRPRWCLLENVDRLLKSPVLSRGRDFAIILSSLMRLGYAVEWRVVNSAEYGFPQRRKRTFLLAEVDAAWDVRDRLADGVMSSAFPCRRVGSAAEVRVGLDPYAVTSGWSAAKSSPFRSSGVAVGGECLTCDVTEAYEGPRLTLGDVLVDAGEVGDGYWIDDDRVARWSYLKGAKRERRVAANGHEWWYAEGQMAFPDSLDRPSRTILTSEGGSSPSRMKHVVEQGGRLRRLVPEELEALQGFPRGWTDTGMTDSQRAFCMGNALVVGVVGRIGTELAERL